MKRPSIKDMTLRQKIGQTGFPGPKPLLDGIIREGGFDKYFQKYPFAGMFIYGTNMVDHQGDNITATREKLVEVLEQVQAASEIPLFVTCDAENGAKGIVKGMHDMPTMMSMGAASDPELAYKRSFYYAKELRSCGINWAFSPVVDLLRSFFDPSVRVMSDEPEIVVKLLPHMLRGYRDAGVASTVKHFPSSIGDYRDSHISNAVSKLSREEWNHYYLDIYKTAVEAGADSVMVGHSAFPAVDSSCGREGVIRPSSASKKVLDILRKELKYDGVIVTDAVAMKAYASAFAHDEGYIEGFNAGNDLILFCHDDYIDIMEQAVLDGRVSMERLDESVERILTLKEKLGLFEDNRQINALTEEENQAFEQVNYNIGKKAITQVKNVGNVIPFDTDKVKKAVVICLSEEKGFEEKLQPMAEALKERGIEVTLAEGVESKAQMKEFSETQDIIICACKMSAIHCTLPDLRRSLFHVLAYGAEKTVIASFGTPSVYYNYFEMADAYLNAYSYDPGTMRAFVDGILGNFAFTAKSPVKLIPEIRC